MNGGIKAMGVLALAALGGLVACSGSGSTGGSGGSGGASSSSSSASSGSGGSGGCGGGCLDPGQCYESSECKANEYCLHDNCYPIGQCTPMPDACTPDPVCGCNGKIYADACTASADGQSGYLSYTECSDPPAGQFPCGTGYCTLASEYCRQGTDGALSCMALPAECAADPSCSCVIDKTTCGTCTPTKGGGELLTQCTD